MAWGARSSPVGEHVIRQIQKGASGGILYIVTICYNISVT